MTIYTTRTAAQAVARARLYSTYAEAMCLNFVWNALDAPQRIYCGSAIESWSRATKKVTTGTPPAGAPVYFRGGQWGHIALSLGGGYIRSTDWPYKGRVGTTTINDLQREWYGSTDRYLGWSRDLVGHLIPGLQPVTSATSNMAVDLKTTIRISHLKVGMSNWAVGRYQKALWNLHGPQYRANILTLTPRSTIGAGHYGDVTRKMTVDAFRGLGSRETYQQPGPWLLRKLGFTDIRA